MRRTGMLVGLCLVVVGCAADGDDSLRIAVAPPATVPGAPDATAATGAVVEIVALDNNYLPAEARVAVGTEVRWTNRGRNDHDVLPADDPTAQSWGVRIADFAPGAEYSTTFDRPGTYVYYCSVHGTAAAGMFGVVVVTAP